MSRIASRAASRALTAAGAFGAALLLSAGAAQAVVVDMSAAGSGQGSVEFNTAARGGYYGVALVPSERTAPDAITGSLSAAGIPYVSTTGGCDDPALAMTPDLLLPDSGICFHGGVVMHGNETFALTWDPQREYWAATRGYVEQFLRDVADGSGTLTSPYADTSQYTDASGRAANRSKYGGGCIDYGNPTSSSNRNSTCVFGSGIQTAPGNNYPGVNGCAPSGSSFTDYSAGTNNVCLTDAQLRGELNYVVAQMHMLSHVAAGYTPVVDLLLPAQVEVCLDAAGKVCSANGSLKPPAPALSTAAASSGSAGVPAGSYQVEVTYQTAKGEQLVSEPQSIQTSGDQSTITIASPPPAEGATGWFAYVIGPGATSYSRLQASATPIGSSLTFDTMPTGGPAPAPLPSFCSYHSYVQVDGVTVAYVVQPWTAMTECDEPDAPQLPQSPSADVLAKNIGIRLVSPLSRSQIAAIVNPWFGGWFGQDGSEVDDHGACLPQGHGLDSVTVGSSGQNPYLLQREFNNAAVIESDPITYFGCAPNVLLTPNFVLPSAVEHGDVVVFDGSTTASSLLVPNEDYRWSFGDGTTAVGPSVTHAYANGGIYHVTLSVTDRGGNARSLTQSIQVLGPTGTPSGSGGPGSAPSLHVQLQLMPQSLSSVIHQGLAVRVRSDHPADGFATLSIGRQAALRAHIAPGHRSAVVIGRGTVSGIKAGVVNLRVHMSAAIGKKLSHLGRVTLTLRLELTGTNGGRLSIDAAGQY